MSRMNALKLRELVFDKLEGAYCSHYKPITGRVSDWKNFCIAVLLYINGTTGILTAESNPSFKMGKRDVQNGI
ncbi:hypothetical protein [Thermosediminibacter litoriperuensis]|uniref:hypothetical protein n=1 Tax=Thermosediminibacter litoriperuensis TaxID=291989 RepID=UPI0014788AD5|nr:hypothetical protein [Thermosediminibacter litoriperuensis]